MCKVKSASMCKIKGFSNRFLCSHVNRVKPWPGRVVRGPISEGGPARPGVCSVGRIRRSVAGAVVDDVGGAPTDFNPLVLQPLTGPVLRGVVAQCAGHGGDQLPPPCLYPRCVGLTEIS